jgi:hypothetical protein
MNPVRSKGFSPYHLEITPKVVITNFEVGGACYV